MIKKFSLVTLLVAFVSQAWAGGYIRLNLNYEVTETGSEDVPSKVTRTVTDFGGGHVTSGGWTIGGLYSKDSKKSDGAKKERTSMGPTFGWMEKNRGPFILATYFLKVETDDKYEGKGYQVDFGYKFPLGPVAFAPQIAYRKVTYDKQGSADLDPAEVDNGIDPYFAIFIEF